MRRDEEPGAAGGAAPGEATGEPTAAEAPGPAVPPGAAAGTPAERPAPRPDRSARPAQPAGAQQASRPLKVLAVLGRMERGGVELRMVGLLRRLDPDEFRLQFAVTDPRPGTLDAEIRALGGEIHPCAAGAGFPWRFRRLLRRLRPDVVHTTATNAYGLVMALAWLAGVPRRVVLLVGSPTREGPLGVLRFVNRVLTDAFATDLLAVSEAAMRTQWREGWRLDPRCRIVYTGVELEPFGVAIAALRPPFPVVEDIEQPAPSNGPVVLLHIGRTSPVKNRPRAVEVLAALRGRGVDARLRLVGRQTPAEAAELTALASRLGVADHVEMLGERSDIPKLLVSSSLLLVTSIQEGMPDVVLEACAVGTPVLSSDLPAVTEIARVLPGITVLPLGMPNEIWADTIRELVAVVPTLQERREAMRTLRRSPFTMEHWQRVITEVWQGRRQ